MCPRSVLWRGIGSSDGIVPTAHRGPDWLSVTTSKDTGIDTTSEPESAYAVPAPASGRLVVATTATPDRRINNENLIGQVLSGCTSSRSRATLERRSSC
jgi:hypothetical protein